ncbi:MAG: hypothetical protein AAB919_00775 [Patescibacteria group bacterium]
MENDIKQQIKRRFEELPVVVRQAIQSSNLEAKLQDIGAKEGLHIDQIGDLQDETLLVMMAFTDPEEFPKQLEDRVHLPLEKATAIAEEIHKEIFMPIRESMKKYMEEKIEDAETDVTAIATLENQRQEETGQKPIPNKPDLSAAENMLQTKTVSAPSVPKPATPTKSETPQSQNYTTDPYREPPK